MVIALGAFAVLGLVACGSEEADLLPGDTASEITSNLEQVKDLAAANDCVGAEAAAQSVSTQIEQLGGVDAKLKQTLREGAARLNEVVADCQEATVEEEDTSPAIDEAEEPEAEEEKEKPAETGKSKKDEEAEDLPEETTTPTLPPQAEGEAKGHEKQEEEVPPAETGGTPSGGVGPAEPAGSE
jgi:hypothetical protein